MLTATPEGAGDTVRVAAIVRRGADPAEVARGEYRIRLHLTQLQSLLGETLVERFNADWWRNPNCGPWMVESLFGEAQRELAHEQALRVSGKTLSFAPLIRGIENMLN